MDSGKGKLPSQLGFGDPEPYSVQQLKLQSQRHIKLSGLFKTEDTLMASPVCLLCRSLLLLLVDQKRNPNR